MIIAIILCVLFSGIIGVIMRFVGVIFIVAAMVSPEKPDSELVIAMFVVWIIAEIIQLFARAFAEASESK